MAAERSAAPGGGRIPTEVLQVMVYILDYGLDPLDAVRMPRIFPSAGNTRVQLAHGFPPQLLQEVRARGYEPLAESAGYARLYLVKRLRKRWVGVSDPQRDGQPRRLGPHTLERAVSGCRAWRAEL